MFQKLFVFLFFLCSICVNAQKKYHKAYFTNGLLKEEGWTSKSQKNGYWKFYYKNGNIKKEGHCFKYHQSKLIKAEKYKSGKKIKEWTDLKSFKKENSLSDLY